MQGEYSPVISHALMAGTDKLQDPKSIVQRIVLEFSKIPIKKITCKTRTKGDITNIAYVEFLLRNDKVEKFGDKSLEEKGWTYKEASISIPPYDYIRSISFFGKEEIIAPHPGSSTASLKAGKQEVRRVSEFTGFALDIIP
jgi:hypothetical protein